MTDHRRTLALAASAIDFALTPGESTELEAHLARCPECRRAAVRLRAAATDLRDRPRPQPSAGLRQRIEAQISSGRGWHRGLRPTRIAFGAALVMIAAVAGLALLPSFVEPITVGPRVSPTPAATAGLGDIATYLGLGGPASGQVGEGGNCNVVIASDCASPVKFAFESVWFGTPDSVVRFDPRSATVVARIVVGKLPHRIWSAAGSIWTTVELPGMLVRIDPATNTIIASIPIDGSPAGITDAVGSIWVTEQAGHRVVRVDPETNTISASIPLSVPPWGISALDGIIWVADSHSQLLSKIDPASNSVVDTIETGTGPSDPSVRADVVAGIGQIWFTGPDHEQVQIYDPASGVLRHMLTQTYPRIAISSDAVWTAGGWNAVIQRYDPTTLLLTGQAILYSREIVPFAGWEASIDLAPDGALWVATDQGNRIINVTPTP